MSADKLIKGNLYCYCVDSPIQTIDEDGKEPLQHDSFGFLNQLEIDQAEMNRARKKYNSSNVNVYVDGEGADIEGMINVKLYKSGSYVNILIKESLQINDQYEMEAILEVIIQHKNIHESEYGTKRHMRSQWVAHNMAYGLATGNGMEKWIIEKMYGKNADEIVTSSKALDLRPYGNFTRRQQLFYSWLEGFIPAIHAE